MMKGKSFTLFAIIALLSATLFAVGSTKSHRSSETPTPTPTATPSTTATPTHAHAHTHTPTPTSTDTPTPTPTPTPTHSHSHSHTSASPSPIPSPSPSPVSSHTHAHSPAASVTASAAPMKSGHYKLPYEYLGCFKDGGDRDLPHNIGNEATPQSCFELARAKNFKYFGLQYYGECWAGDSHDQKHGRGDLCTTPCNRNKEMNCGGPSHNAVYVIPDVSQVVMVQNKGVPGFYEHKGCFVDKEQRDLPNHIGDNTTPQTCYDLAKGRNYKFFGVQYHGECWGGNTYNTHGAHPADRCRMFCTADRSQVCGGPYANSIYEIKA